jgi:two-component system sensor histidine kinase BarA
MISSQRAELLDNLHNTGRVVANQIASNAEFALYSVNQDMLEALGYAALGVPSVSGVVFYNVKDNKSFVIGDMDLSPQALPDTLTRGQPLLKDGNWYFYSTIVIQLNTVNDYEESARAETETLGWVVLAFNDQALLQKQQDAIFAALLVISMALLMSAWLSMRIGRSISGPLDDLTQVVELMEAGNLVSLSADDGPLELRKLAYGIDQLATSVRQSNERMQREIARATAQLQTTLIELEEAMEAQDQFLARMSHELRTPLTAVIGFSKLLSSESDDSKRDEHRLVIERSSTMLLTMIDDILEFSKAHSGGFTLENINFDLIEWVADLIAIHRPLAEEKHLDFSYEIDLDVPTKLSGDPVRLAQIMSNLISNAIKFTDSGFVSVKISCLSIEAGAVNLQCLVADSGKGIAQDKIGSLFDPFVQEDTSINRRFGGTGLGLSISQRLAQRMGGDVSIDSSEAKGSNISFTCCLAAADADQEAAVEAGQLAISQQVLSGLTILLAEDNLFNQKLIVRLLKGYGASCMVANNGLEAIEIADKLHVDLVLMDLHMPLVDGVTACEVIMQQSGESPPIIGLTADITQAEQQRMLSAGALTVELKPINEIELVNAILGALSDQRTVLEDSHGGLLASVIPAEELKAALYENLDKLEQQLRSSERSSLRQIIHDLMGLCGLYGMSELRELVLEFRATYGTLDENKNLKKVSFIRQHISDFFDD